MDDLLKEIGLQYAKSLPTALGVLAAGLVVIAFLAKKVMDGDPEYRNLGLGLLAVAALVVVIQWPAAYARTKDDCRKIWNAGPVSYSTAAPAVTDLLPNGVQPTSSSEPGESLEYRLQKCDQVWPYGPDVGR